MAFNPTERMAALAEMRGQIEDLVAEVNKVYDPAGYDESMGGLAMMLNNAHSDLDKVIEQMIHDHGGKNPYGD